MAFSIGGNLNNVGGEKESRLFLDPIFFSQIFSGVPEFYAGSTIQVQEILTILLFIPPGNELKIDVDFGWFQNHEYLGTYQLLSGDASTSGVIEGDEGYLTNQIQKIRRYSNYTIVADPAVQIGTGEVMVTDDCNFRLEGVTVDLPPFEIGQLHPQQATGLFQSAISLTKVGLRDTEFNKRIPGFGLYYAPGVNGYSWSYDVAVVNTIATDLVPFPVTQCATLAVPCQQEFDAFFAGLPDNGFADHYALTPGGCNIGEIPDLRVFNCADGGTRDYYFCGGAN